MQVSKITELTVFESPDGGRTVYARKPGSTHRELHWQDPNLQQELKELYYEGGSAWLFDGDHDWQEEDCAVHVIAPYQVDLCEDDGTVIKENVKLKKRPKPDAIINNNWPFPFPKDSEQGG